MKLTQFLLISVVLLQGAEALGQSVGLPPLSRIADVQDTSLFEKLLLQTQAEQKLNSKYGYNFKAPCVGSKIFNWSDCFGKYIFYSGAIYIGSFDKLIVEGEQTFPNGDQWGDEFVSWKLASPPRRFGASLGGTGIYTYSNGDKYVGEFLDNHFNGDGIYKSKDGLQYWGEWKNSKLRKLCKSPPNLC